MTYNFAYDNRCLKGQIEQSNYFYAPKINMTIPVNGIQLNKQISLIRSPVFTSIEQALKNINFYTTQECIKSKKKFIYWITINPFENSTHTKFNYELLKKNNIFSFVFKPLIESINNGMCMLCFEDTLRTSNTFIKSATT